MLPGAAVGATAGLGSLVAYGVAFTHVVSNRLLVPVLVSVGENHNWLGECHNIIKGNPLPYLVYHL